MPFDHMSEGFVTLCDWSKTIEKEITCAREDIKLSLVKLR